MKSFSKTLILFVLIVTGCEDKIIEPEGTIINRSTVCPAVNPELIPSPVKFAGLLFCC